MALRMAKLVRDPKSGSWKSRKVIPADVREVYGRANETPTWPATLTAAQAKAAWSGWLSEVEGRIDRLRRMAAAEPVRLTHREVHALAGKWYQQQVQTYGDSPGDPKGWEALADQIEPVDEEAAAEALRNGEGSLGRLRRIPWVEDEGARLLEREGVVPDATSRDALLERMHELVPALSDLMQRRARGDFGRDPVAATLPSWEPAREGSAPVGVTLTELFDRYAAERQPAAATVKAWKRQLGHLKAFLGHEDASRITADEIVRWKDDLLAGSTTKGGPRSAKTVRDTYLAAARTVLSYGLENRLVSSNAAAGITVRGPKKVRLRDRGLSDAEALTILRGTLAATAKRYTPERALAVRWVPWLCAYSGARVNEMTQLRKEDVALSEGVWVMRITPEAGSTKTGQAREVPLHPHLIEQGFLEVVRKATPGPLFYDPKRHRGGTDGNPQSKKVGEALARWVRQLGVDDPNVPPNHGWRHRFETEMRRAGIDFEARHALTGHAYKTEGGTYGHWSPAALHREIEKLPRYQLDPQP